MESSKKYLLEVVDEQKKTIEKYTNKLRDVVAAHKSLLIEKKALEDALKILNSEKNPKTETEAPVEKDDSKHKTDEASEAELKNQLSSVLTSFSNVVAEKSHMEECFKINQKQLLDEKKAVEIQCDELQKQVKLLRRQLRSLENKTPVEFSQKNTSNQKIQSLDNQNKAQNVESEVLALKIRNYEKEIKNLKLELQSKQIIHELSEKKLNESSAELRRLQDEIRNLQIEHEMAISNEKEKAKSVEEHAKKLTAVQEERVFNLETRLAELSDTIGSYDRLRLQDQIEIQKLKEHIAFIDISPKNLVNQQKSEELSTTDYEKLKEKFLNLKNQLRSAALKYNKEEDFKNIFCEDSNLEETHFLCKEAYDKLKTEYEHLKNDIKLFKNQGKSSKDSNVLQNQIKNLQEKIKILTDKKKDTEKEYQVQIEQLKKTLKNEKARHKETIATLENNHKARIWLLEEQLQKQRERSVALLEEKEQEVHTLQSTIQMFLPGYKRNVDDESEVESSSLTKTQLVDGPHIVHYANELARKDIEISSLRRSKHQVEVTLRDLQKELVSTAEKYKEEKEFLLSEIARLERCQTREGANLEYLKNVVYNFLLSSDPKSKRHMYNAIAAVLKFSESELQKVIDHSKNSWWTHPNIL